LSFAFWAVALIEEFCNCIVDENLFAINKTGVQVQSKKVSYTLKHNKVDILQTLFAVALHSSRDS
jgi:hypothetical protein